MKITIFASGSRGDVQPYIALGLGLINSGYEVDIATHSDFEEFVTTRGLGFKLLRGNPREILETEQGLALLETGKNPLKTMGKLVDIMKPFIESAMIDSWEACKDTDIIICSTLSYQGIHIAEKKNIPVFYAILQPFLRTKEEPCMSFPELPGIFKGLYNKFTYLTLEQLLFQPMKKLINKYRKEIMDLPPIPFWGTYDAFYKKMDIIKYSPIPSLCGFSNVINKRPLDWQEWIHITGYWFLNAEKTWKPPRDLIDFIEDGDPPVYIGFGSMKSRDPQETTEIAVNALKKSKKRGILMTGWGGVNKSDSNDNIYFIDSIPHDWLFPKMSAVIHHGGAGTTSAGLKAGVPSILIPFFGDQIYWGEKIYKLGLGTYPIPRKALNTERLSKAINIATTNENIINNSKSIGNKLKNENGIENAVNIFNNYILEYNYK